MHAIELPEDYALVLQQVAEAGEEDFVTLAETLCLERGRLLHIVRSLSHKGLLKIRFVSSADTWLSLSSKGRRFMAALWPEMPSKGFV